MMGFTACRAPVRAAVEDNARCLWQDVKLCPQSHLESVSAQGDIRQGDNLRISLAQVKILEGHHLGCGDECCWPLKFATHDDLQREGLVVFLP